MNQENKSPSFTYFALLGQFGTNEIPLDKCCQMFFDIVPKTANARAMRNQLPVPAYRMPGSQKNPWLVDARKLAEYIDALKKQAEEKWSLDNKFKAPV